MRQLILLRHAKTLPAANGQDDFDRMLADAGREAAPRMAAALVDAGAAPDIVLVSTARRARETWELAAPAFPKADTRFVDGLYLCPADVILREAEASGASRVMVVGHNPGMHELASRLAHRNTILDQRVRAKFPTAAAAVFERRDEASSWKLMAYLTPKGGAA